MQAIRAQHFGGPEVMELEEVDVPSVGPDEILITVKAAGVNPVDTYIRTGTYAIQPPLPYTPGLDGAGIVEIVGPEVNNVQPGDRVYCAGSVTGTYAEKAVCTATQVYPLPEHISFTQGAAIGIPYATAYRALYHKAQARAGQSVLVHGASGAVGLAAVQMACALGLTTLGTAGSQAGRELVLSQGASMVYDHHDTGRLSAIRDQTNGQGVDIILEMLANTNLAADLELLAKGGCVVVIGNRGSIEINPRMLMGQETSIHGMVLMNATANEMNSIHAGIAAGLADGTLNPVVGLKLLLKDATRAHREVIEASHQGKIVLTV